VADESCLRIMVIDAKASTPLYNNDMNTLYKISASEAVVDLEVLVALS